MKILVVCQYYKPEPFRVSDICEELVKHGHEVTVITGVPNYPEGVIYKGYENCQRREETINGVKVHRCFTIPRKTGALYRFLNYFSFSISSTIFARKCKSSDGSPFDVVFVNQLSPVMMGNAALAYGKKYKVPTVLYCLDLWPESLIAGGIRRDSLIYKIFSAISKRIYCGANHILITSRLFEGYLQEKFGIAKRKIHYLPQYAEDLFESLPRNENSDTIDLMFAGNIGAAQSIKTILDAAQMLKDEYSNLWFHIVGSGSELEHLKKIAAENELDNVIFYGRRRLDEMPELYKNADAFLITLQADPVLSMTLPGKVQSYLAVGKPVIGAIDGETQLIIDDAKCGFCAKAEDAEGLAQCIRSFVECPTKETLGINARKYYDQHFSRKQFFETLEYYLRDGYESFDD